MSYFQKNYSKIDLTPHSETKVQLRRPQIGAIHSIASYFTRSLERNDLDPAIIVLPTGTGKTAVLVLSPFLLKAKRALIITQSQIVRRQIFREFSELLLLKKLKILPENIPSPKVYELDKMLKSEKQWQDLMKNDVIISTPACISPQYKEIYQTPKDAFDLILYDEGHHLPAKTWFGISNYFDSMEILFTATPFRNDKKSVYGKIIYEFTMSEAYKDGIFGNIKFIPVEVSSLEPNDNDIAIAKKTEEIFKKDKDDGYKHLVLVRSSKIEKSKELLEIYNNHTDLSLKLINSQHSQKTVQSILKELQEGKIDGVIAVDIMNEGVDIPLLKIAAIHSAYKSLSILLQFIGRFARTGQRIGDAKFIATPQNVTINAIDLYREDKKWQEIIPKLYDSKIQEEVELRDGIYSFNAIEIEGVSLDETIARLSLFEFKPKNHAKVYQIENTVDLQANLELKGWSIIKKDYSSKLSCVVFLSKRIEKPRWATTNILSNIEYQLIVIVYFEATKLLFINSSIKSDFIYDDIVEQISNGGYYPLSTDEINRALTYLESPEFYNIGMKRRTFGTSSESYRMIAGPRVENAIKSSDGYAFERGHVVGKSRSKGENTTLGVSSLSKIWSYGRGLIPQFVDWCRIFNKILPDDTIDIETGTNLDKIKTGSKLDTIPDKVVFVNWNDEIYKNTALGRYEISGEFKEINLLDFSLEIITQAKDSIHFKIYNHEIEWKCHFRLQSPLFTQDNSNPIIKVEFNEQERELIEFMNTYPVQFYTKDLSIITGNKISKTPSFGESFDRNNIETMEWDNNNVDITSEVIGSSEDGLSIQEFLRDHYRASSEIVFFDHGTGEIADILLFNMNQKNELLIDFVHIKSSSQSNPGQRVKDVEELFGQMLRSIKWTQIDKLISRIKKRMVGSSYFYHGNFDRIIELKENCNSITFRIIGVQPGLSKNRLTDRVLFSFQSLKNFVSTFNIESVTLLISE